MNFKKFCINGGRFSITILYRTKIYRLHFESWWNGLMCKLTLMTTKKKLSNDKK
jgi:hypothetical protein